MPRNLDEKLTKHTLHLFDGDIKQLQDLYPQVGAAAVIRKLIRSHIESMTPDATIPKVEISLD